MEQGQVIAVKQGQVVAVKCGDWKAYGIFFGLDDGRLKLQVLHKGKPRKVSCPMEHTIIEVIPDRSGLDGLLLSCFRDESVLVVKFEMVSLEECKVTIKSTEDREALKALAENNISPGVTIAAEERLKELEGESDEDSDRDSDEDSAE